MNNFDTTSVVAVTAGIIFPLYLLFTAKRTIKELEENPDTLSDVYKSTGGCY